MKDFKKADTMSLFLQQQQPRNLTLARHKLGIHQLRIMARVVERMQPYMSMEVDYTKETEDIWVDLNVSDLVISNNVKPLRAAFESLMKKVVRMMHWLDEKNTWLEIGTTLIKEYEYEHGDSVAKVQLSGRLLPQLIDLARGYTRYSLQVAFTTSSPNIYKLYQYFAHFRDKKQVQCNLDTLRKWLQLENKYSKPKSIKQWILDPAIRELKEKADVWFDIAERIKDGRRFVGWKFNIYTKKERRPKTLTPEKTLLTNENIRQKEAEIRAKQQELVRIKEAKNEADYKAELTDFYKLSESQAKKLITYQEKHKNSMPKVAKLLVGIRNKAGSGIANIGAYTVQVLKKQLNIDL